MTSISPALEPVSPHRLIDIASTIVAPRCRVDIGNVASVAASIAELGLLHPVVITPNNLLIAGARRIAAFRRLGRAAIPAATIDLDRVAHAQPGRQRGDRP